MSPLAKEVWVRVAAVQEALGHRGEAWITVADHIQLEIVCEAYSTWVNARNALYAKQAKRKRSAVEKAKKKVAEFFKPKKSKRGMKVAQAAAAEDAEVSESGVEDDEGRVIALAEFELKARKALQSALNHTGLTPRGRHILTSVGTAGAIVEDERAVDVSEVQDNEMYG